MQTRIAPRIDWVGHLDWTVRDFHGYRTEHGSTYNAYLVRDRRTALIDGVKGPYADALLRQVAALTPLDRIDYLVCNHAEPDHSSALPALRKACPRARIVCNARCRDALQRHFDTAGWEFETVADGGSLSLGEYTLQFFDTPMVHWPESMATFLPEAGVLFSMDAFGQHMASSQRFAEELAPGEALAAAKTYYANIVMPFGAPVAKALERLGALPIRTICPSHGVCWRESIPEILEAYARWRVCEPTRKVVVLYSTMWDSTRQMAQAVVEGVAEQDVAFRLIDVNATHDTETVTEIIDCAAFAVGTPTLNQGMMPAMARCLTYLRGLKPAHKAAFAFGSHGWAQKGAGEAEGYLKAMQAEILRPPLVTRYRPDPETLDACREAGRLLARHALAVTA